jgi:PAS domain S-box-containing protein
MTRPITGPDVPIFDHEKVQKALRDSEMRLRSVVNSASMVLWAVDRHGVFTFSEGKALDRLGLRSGDVVGRTLEDVYAEVPKILEDNQRALAGEEFTTVTDLGGLTFEARYSPLREESGEITGVIGVAVDVTERRRAEEEQSRTLSLLAAALESTADGILVVDAAGRISTFNRKFAEMWNLPLDILETGDDAQAISHVVAQLRDPEVFVAKVRELYDNPGLESFDVLEFKDGRTFERYSIPQRIGAEVIGRVWSFREVTERRRAEDELKRRERQLEHTQRLTHLGSWQWDVASDSVSWSDELYRIYGLDPGAFAPTFSAYLERVHPEDRGFVEAQIERAIRETGAFDFVERIVRPSGEVRVLRSQGEVVADEAGDPLRLVGACHDITEQKTAEEALRNAEASYRTIFELSNDAIFIHDIETGAVVDANRKACELHGCTLAELQAPGDLALSSGCSPGSLEEARWYLERAAADQPQLFERQVRQPSGACVWVEVSLRRITINGQDRLLATARDVTERKEAESVLKRSHEELERLVEERTSELAQTNMALEEEIADRERAEEELRQRTAELEAVFHALPDLYFRLDADGTILDHRSGRDSSLVLGPDSYLGERIQDLLPAEARGRMEEGLAEVARTGSLFRLEYSLPFEDGDRDYEARILPVPDGHVITIVRDITDRQRAERALRKSEEHFRRLIENSTDVATILGPDGINRYQSPAILQVFGYTPEETIGTNTFERIHPEDGPRCREVLMEMMRNPGETRSVEFRYRHKDGSWRVVEARARTLLPDSAAEGVVVNSRDITERKRYEEALHLAKEEADLANRAKSDFLSRMSHELRTPMNSILGFGQLLARKDLPPDQRKSVDHILKAGRHLLNLINEVLEISRIEAGRQNLSLEPVHLATVLQEARSLIQPLAVQSGLTLADCEADPRLYVHADRQRLVQVLLNLLSNAVKYNRPNGHVSVSCVERSNADGSPVVAIGVSDTGPGIPGDKLGRLFVPFERLDAGQSEVEGTGLGLALSQRLVEAMGGSLSVDTRIGEGSTFWVELGSSESPLARAERAGNGVAAPGAADGAAKTATILYIEDNLPNLALIETILADRPGVTLLSALQGQMGVYLAAENRPDLILLDMHLPDIRGDEVLRRLKEDARTREIPVVVVSADATPASLERLSAAGVSAYLTKPLDVGEFLGTLDRFLTPAGG